jgi:hypothetical protein
MPPLSRQFIKSALVHLVVSSCSSDTLSMGQSEYPVEGRLYWMKPEHT